MAEVRLGRYEVERYDLPRVCMRCGAAAAVSKDHKFQWTPPWVFILLFLGLLPYAIVATIVTRRMTLPVPLCEKHKWHWGGRIAFTLVVLFALIALFIGGGVLVSEPANEQLAPVIFIPLGVLALAWLVTAIALSATTIRPKEITDNSITLSGVAPEFIDALNEARAGTRDDEGDRSRRRRGRADEEDDDRPRRRRARVVDDEEEEEGPPRRRPRGADDERVARRGEEGEEEGPPRRRPRGADDDGGYYDPESPPRRRPRDPDEDDR